MNRARFDLHHHLPFLLRRAHFHADAVFTEVYGTQVTSRQLAVLVSIGQREGLSQAQIAQEVGLDPNTCSDLVARMVGKGLLARQRSAADGRVFELKLTAQGMQVAREGAASAPAYQKRVTERLTAAQREQLAQLLRRMLDFD